MADTKDVEKYYFDYLKKTEKFPQSVYHRAKHIEVSKIIGSLQRRSKILDAGCGIGNITGRYAKNHRIVGIDSQPEALKYAGAHYDGDYRQEDIYNINLPDNEFDLVLFLDAIEHFHRPVDALKELHRVTKPGCKIMICTINYDNPLWPILENTWHRFFGGNCRTFSKEVHPTRYTESLLREHANTYFKEVESFKRILRMELFYIGEK